MTEIKIEKKESGSDNHFYNRKEFKRPPLGHTLKIKL